MSHFHILRLLLLPAAALLLGGCLNLSPDYAPPVVSGGMPAEYKEDKGWKTAQPKETQDRGAWWETFGDARLNELMGRLNAANQSIAVAAANFRQARAQIGVARSALLPGVSLPAQATRSGTEGEGAGSRYSVGVNSQWEISFWNALPALEAAKAQSGAMAAEYSAMRLAMQAELAQSYFQLRMYDSRQSLYESTIDAYAKAAQLTRSQLRGGMVTRADVDQAEAQLASAEAQLAAVKRQRSALEHGIAVLCGQMPSTFSLERAELTARVPAVPAGLPAELLERRPDVAAAERRVASANEQIGLARAAWFPSLSLGGEFLEQASGWHSATLYTWSVGPSAALSLFQGGRRFAESDAAWAGYEGEVASYRQTVLEAVRDVEDNLAALRHLEAEAEAQARAVKSSGSALNVSLSQYRGGMTTYLQVVANQTAALNAQNNAVEVQGMRLTATVNLIKALGGGWRTDELARLTDGPLPQEGVVPH